MAAALPVLATLAVPFIQKALNGGNDNGLERVPTMSRGQKKLHQMRGQQATQLGGQGGGYQNAIDILMQMLSPGSQTFQNFAAPYKREFEEQTIPGLAERFAGFGAQGGALSSSGFGQALGAAGAGLQENLAGLQETLKQSAIERLINQYNQLSQDYLGNPEFAYVNQQQGGSPGAGGINSFLQNMSPGSMQSILGLFQGGGNSGGYNMGNMSSGGMAQFGNLMNSAQGIRS